MFCLNPQPCMKRDRPSPCGSRRLNHAKKIELNIFYIWLFRIFLYHIVGLLRKISLGLQVLASSYFLWLSKKFKWFICKILENKSSIELSFWGGLKWKGACVPWRGFEDRCVLGLSTAMHATRRVKVWHPPSLGLWYISYWTPVPI